MGVSTFNRMAEIDGQWKVQFSSIIYGSLTTDILSEKIDLPNVFKHSEAAQTTPHFHGSPEHTGFLFGQKTFSHILILRSHNGRQISMYGLSIQRPSSLVFYYFQDS